MVKKFLKDFFKNNTNILFIFVVLSLVILPITYSRYIETEFGSGLSYLAKWEVDLLEDSSNNVELVARNVWSADYLFTITSTSDVASIYGIVISGVPSGVTVTLEDMATNVATDYTPTSGTVSISSLGEFSVSSSGQSHQYKITFKSTTTSLPTTSSIDLQADIKQKITGGA